jgi:hypothetical protein
VQTAFACKAVSALFAVFLWVFYYICSFVEKFYLMLSSIVPNHAIKTCLSSGDNTALRWMSVYDDNGISPSLTCPAIALNLFRCLRQNIRQIR